MNSINSLLLLCLTIWCSEARAERHRYPNEIIDQLLNEEKYDEAQSYIEKNHIPEESGLKKIKRTQACIATYRDCEKPTDDLQKIRGCVLDLKKNCDNRYVAPAWEDRTVGLTNDMLTQEEKLEQRSPFHDLCKNGMKWGYMKKSKSDCSNCGMPDFVNYKDLSGSFETRNKCEERRALDPSSKGDQCYERYTGSPITVTTFDIKALQIEANRTKQLDLKFSDAQKCAVARANGTIYIDQLRYRHKISKVDSNGETRFIGACKANKTLACDPNKRITPNDIDLQ